MLDIKPIFLSDIFQEAPPELYIKQMKIGFFDGAEKATYNDLLDEVKFNFELSFEKEKADLFIHGLNAEKTKDESKIEINIIALKDGGWLEIFFKPQFAGVAKITCRDSYKKPNKNENNRENNQSKDINQEISNLQNQINALEKKISKQPNSVDNSVDKKKLQELKNEIESKRKIKINQEKSKDNFPYGLVIGGGVIIVVLLLVIAFLIGKNRKN